MPRKPKPTAEQKSRWASQKAEQAEAKRKLGLVPRQVWARPEHWGRIMELVDSLTQRPSAK